MAGVFLPHRLEDISLKDVYLAVNIPLIQQNWQLGDLEATCLVSSGITAVMEGLFEQLNQTAVEQLIDLNTRRKLSYE